MESLFEAIVTPGMASLAGMAIGFMLFIGLIPYKGKKINQTKFWEDWGAHILVVVCLIGAFIPGVNDIPLANWGSILIFGMTSALAAYFGRKILKPIILTKLEGKEKFYETQRNFR